MKKFLYFLSTLILVLWVQLASHYFIGSTGFSPNIIICAVLYFGLSRGPISGELMGFFWGLLMDAGSLGLMGLHALLYSGAGFMAGVLRRQLDEDKGWTQAIFTLGVTVLYVIFYFVLDRLFASGAHPMSWTMLGQPLVNAVAAPFVFGLMRAWTEAWSMVKREN